MAYDMKQIVRRHFEEVWNNGNVDLVDEIIDPNYQGYLALAGKLDRDGLKSTVLQYKKSFPDLRFELKDTVVEADKVMVRWIASGTHKATFLNRPPTNNKAIVHGFTMFEVKNGRIIKDRTEYDEVALLNVIGVELPPAAMIAQQFATELRR